MKKNMTSLLCCLICVQIFFSNIQAQAPVKNNDDLYRPQLHFTPTAHWINDPNGMVYYKGVYHLFFQYHPYSTIWGPMHWGHATSRDLIHWKEEAIAFYPDSLGTIFSGSAVVDRNNTSGFGKKGQIPLVAIFTQHNTEGEKAGRNDFQNQSIGYSLDEGKTWKKYSLNPVLKNPGITDFRDPKVMWYEPQKKWIMTLATKDRITFYSSPDLKNWKKESEFGADAGFHGGVWECPDLFSLNDNGKKVWVLIVNINPGGPNKGSATQYFLGDFDGMRFTAKSKESKWIDYGPDEYAGITWSNTGSRKIFLGWMSNWLYANQVPTVKWRNAMTIPRELKLVRVNNELYITSNPVTEFSKIQAKPVTVKNIPVTGSLDITKKTGKILFPCRLNLSLDNLNTFSLVLSNELGEELIIGFDKEQNQYYIDRTKSGETRFQQDFAAKHIAPRFATGNKINLSLIIEKSSVELFADDGLTVMTEIFFPGKPYNLVQIKTPERMVIKKLKYINLKSIRK